MIKMTGIQRAIFRLVRVALAQAGATFLSVLFKNPAFIWATPIISSLAKYLREKHPKTYDWIPF